MKQAQPFSIAVSVLFGALVGAVAVSSSQATVKTAPLNATAGNVVIAEATYLPAQFLQAQQRATEQALPAQF